jgi:tRNA(Ile)-lysidine synthetase, N-terminal domain
MHRLPKYSARTVIAIRHFMEEELEVRAPWPLCVAAVSGGADSSALLVGMHALGVPLVAAHLDHGLRPESAAEAAHVQRLAAHLDVPCVVERHDVRGMAQDRKLGLEEAGRLCRYAMLERVAGAWGADWILTGHHLDDLCEDVLLRLIRGSGWPALGGMRARDDERRILRPLLHTPKAALERMLREQDVTWLLDASNAERAVRRNRVRHDILPLLRKENPAFGESVRRLWQLARLDERYWEDALGPAQTVDETGLLLEQGRLVGMAAAARLRLYLRTVRTIAAQQGSGQARVDALLKLDALWSAKRTGALVQMPGVRARITREGVVFCGA